MFHTPNKPSNFKSNFSFISDKSSIMTQSQRNITEGPVFRSSDRATIQPKTSTLEEIDSIIGFASRKNSIVQEETSPMLPKQHPPKILKDLVRYHALLKPMLLSDPNHNSSGNDILHCIILLIMELLDGNTLQNLCLNEFWNLISKYLFYDKPIQFINTLHFLMNNKQKLIIWVFIKLYEHRLDDILALPLAEYDFKDLLKKNCKLIVFKNEIEAVLIKINELEFSINSSIIAKYENFLLEPESCSFSFHFSKYIKNSSVKLSMREDDPIKLWKIKSKTLNFNEFQEKILRKETQEIEELIQDSDFLSNFLRKYYKDAPSPKNSFEKQLKKHRLFLDNLIESMKNPENFKELLEKKDNFIKDFNLVKMDLTQRLEEVQYLKSHTYPNDFHKEEERINSVILHLDYLFSFIDQIFNGVQPQIIEETYESPQNLPLETWGDDEDKNPILNLDYNRNFNLSESSPSQDNNPRTLLSKSNTMSQKYKRKSEKLYLERFSSLNNISITRILKGKPKEMTISEQQNQCHNCRQNISQGLYFFGNNAAFCYYSGFWHCLDCMSPDERVIPYKIIEEFDFTEFEVSNESKDEIDELFEKHIINLPYASEVITKNPLFYEFMVLKREIHLIYNMICEEKLVENLLQDKVNLVLKENIFSLRNLCEIHNGSLRRLLEKSIKLLIYHFDGCQICQKRGAQCEICKSFLKIYSFDIRNTEICGVCKHIYHMKCFELCGCPFCKAEKT